MTTSEITRYAIGADIGGSHISSAVVDLTDGHLCTKPTVTPVDSGDRAGNIIEAWRSNLKATISSSPVPVDSVGLAIPGPFDYRHGISLINGVSKFEKIYGLDVARSLTSRLQDAGIKNIRFVNDASAFALGEALGGAARECESMMALTLGTGVGSGFVRNHTLIESGNDVPANGWVYCLPFEGGIADDAFSTRWIVKRYRELTGESVNGGYDVALRYDRDPAARQLFDEFGSRLATFAIPLMERFGCRTLVLGGNIARAYDLFGPAMKQAVAGMDLHADIRVSALMNHAALTGAASLFV